MTQCHEEISSGLALGSWRLPKLVMKQWGQTGTCDLQILFPEPDKSSVCQEILTC